MVALWRLKISWTPTVEGVGPYVLGLQMSLGEENRDDWVKRLEQTCWECSLGLGEQGKECGTMTYGRRGW